MCMSSLHSMSSSIMDVSSKELQVGLADPQWLEQRIILGGEETMNAIEVSME